MAAALIAGDYEELEDGRVRAAGEELAGDEVIRGERLSVDGFVMADDDVISVALSTELDDELRLEKRVRDLIREINVRRKQEGLDITDRIVVTVPAGDEDLVSEHGDWIKQETLAVELRKIYEVGGIHTVQERQVPVADVPFPQAERLVADNEGKPVHQLLHAAPCPPRRI